MSRVFVNIHQSSFLSMKNFIINVNLAISADIDRGDTPRLIFLRQS